jgi:hypothetical protein
VTERTRWNALADELVSEGAEAKKPEEPRYERSAPTMSVPGPSASYRSTSITSVVVTLDGISVGHVTDAVWREELSELKLTGSFNITSPYTSSLNDLNGKRLQMYVQRNDEVTQLSIYVTSVQCDRKQYMQSNEVKVDFVGTVVG